MATFYGSYSHGNRIDTGETKCPLEIVAINGYPHRGDMLAVGDVVELLCQYGSHAATIEITKLNRRTFDGIEITGSYNAGCKWRVNKQPAGALHLSHYHNPHRRLVELAELGWNRSY